MSIIAIGGGFMEVGPDHVTILADSAERAEEIDEARAEEAQRRAEELMAPEAARGRGLCPGRGGLAPLHDPAQGGQAQAPAPAGVRCRVKANHRDSDSRASTGDGKPARPQIVYATNQMSER